MLFLANTAPAYGRGILAGALAVVTMALGLAGWLALRSFAVRPLLLAFASPKALTPMDQVSFILLGLLWLAMVYLSAYFYQRALERRRLWRLFVRVTLIQVLAPALVVGLVFVLVRQNTPLR